jgi:hypothetical protein
MSRPAVSDITAFSDGAAMTGSIRLVLTFLALFALPSARAEQQPAIPDRAAPVCSDASHARLIVQAGRDVCGPTMLPSGPVSVGFLPTTCPAALPVLKIDAQQATDRCVVKPSAVPVQR